jgi:hypothetical protein
MAANMEMLAEARRENQQLHSQQESWWKAIQSSLSTEQDRQMKADSHRVKMEVIDRGVGMLLQMVPVMAKSLERNKTAELPAKNEGIGGGAEGAIGASPESIAIGEFVKQLSNEEKTALFGAIDPATQKHMPGIFTIPQMQIVSAVGDCSQPPALLQHLLPGGEHSIDADQLTKAQQVVSIDRLMPLYAIIVEGNKSN